MYSVYLLADEDGNWEAPVNQHTVNRRMTGNNSWRNLSRNLNSEHKLGVCYLQSPVLCVSVYLCTQIYIRPRTNGVRGSCVFNNMDKYNLRNFSITKQDKWFCFLTSTPLISAKNLCNILKMTVQFPKFAPMLELQSLVIYTQSAFSHRQEKESSF